MTPEPVLPAEKVRPPRVKLPARAAKWLGPWEVWDVHGNRGKLWVREYLEADGHEDCCAHTWLVSRPYPAAHHDGNVSA